MTTVFSHLSDAPCLLRGFAVNQGGAGDDAGFLLRFIDREILHKDLIRKPFSVPKTDRVKARVPGGFAFTMYKVER